MVSYFLIKYNVFHTRSQIGGVQPKSRIPIKINYSSCPLSSILARELRFKNVTETTTINSCFHYFFNFSLIYFLYFGTNTFLTAKSDYIQNICNYFDVVNYYMTNKNSQNSWIGTKKSLKFYPTMRLGYYLCLSSDYILQKLEFSRLGSCKNRLVPTLDLNHPYCTGESLWF